MEITIKLSKSKRTKRIDLKKGSTVEEVLEKLKIKPDTVVVISKDKPIPIDYQIKNIEELTILQVSSGG
jgi:sulfur carrier protein ThiS